MADETWDVFVSHASEDKNPFVDPLANRLKELAVRVWYDRFSLSPGDRLSEKIAEGLARSRCGLLVISKSFLGKPWPSYEMSGLIGRFVEERMRLIPVWLDVTKKDVAEFNPALADLVAIQAHAGNIESCAMEVLRIVRPRLHENIRLTAGIQNSADWTIEVVPTEKIKVGPVRHHDLPDDLLVRIQNIWFSVRDVFPVSLADTIKNFQCDLRPDIQVRKWEEMVGTINLAMDELGAESLAVKENVFALVLGLGSTTEVPRDKDGNKIDPAIIDAVANALERHIPQVTISDVEDDGGETEPNTITES